MKKTSATPSLTDQLQGSLRDIQEGSVRSLPAQDSLPVVRSFSADDIRAARGSLNMTQSEFAELLQVATKTVQAWEAGRRSPSSGQARWIEMFTSPDWCERLRKPAPHPRGPHRSEAVAAVATIEDTEPMGPRRRLGGHPNTAEPASKRKASGPKQVASAERPQRPATVTERVEKQRQTGLPKNKAT